MKPSPTTTKTATTATKTKPQPRDITKDFCTLISGAEATLRKGTKDLGDDARVIQEDIIAHLQAGKERLRGSCITGKDKIVARVKSADAAIRTNPYKTIAVALAAGAILGGIVARKRKATPHRHGPGKAH